MCVCMEWREWAGEGSGVHWGSAGLGLPAGPVEEVEQVFPDTGLDMEVRDAAGDGQVCSRVPRVGRGLLGRSRAAGAVGQEGIAGSFALRMGPRDSLTASPACRAWPCCWTDWPRRTRTSGCCRPSCRCARVAGRPLSQVPASCPPPELSLLTPTSALSAPGEPVHTPPAQAQAHVPVGRGLPTSTGGSGLPGAVREPARAPREGSAGSLNTVCSRRGRREGQGGPHVAHLR